MKIATMITKNSVTVNYNGETHTVLATDAAYPKVIAAIKQGRTKDIPALMNKPQFVEKESKGEFQVRDGRIYAGGKEIPGQLGRQIMGFLNEGLPFQPLMRFWENLKNNPSYRAVNDLFTFLEKNDHPITEDGKFIAYKRVNRGDDGVLRDAHTGTFVNDPGSVCEMSRNEVDENPEHECSAGLHVANWYYAQNIYGGQFHKGNEMIEVEVDPSDVVAIPTDYNSSKMRVCKYRVRSVVANPNESKHLVRNPEPEVASGDEAPEPGECWEDCEDCGGAGVVNCPSCEGCCVGEGDDDECVDCDGEGVQTCDTCDGEGGWDESPEEDEDSGEKEDPEDEDSDEEMPNIIYHTRDSMRKMSTDRLERYADRVEDYLSWCDAHRTKDDKAEECERIADEILRDRGR